MKLEKISLILRVSLAFAFLYPAISAFFTPFAWIGYFPQFTHLIIPNDLFLLHSFGFIEIMIAIWLIYGKNIFYPSIASAILLFFIIVFNFSQMDVIFRDIPILAIAIILTMLHKPNLNS